MSKAKSADTEMASSTSVACASQTAEHPPTGHSDVAHDNTSLVKEYNKCEKRFEAWEKNTERLINALDAKFNMKNGWHPTILPYPRSRKEMVLLELCERGSKLLVKLKDTACRLSFEVDSYTEMWEGCMNMVINTTSCITIMERFHSMYHPADVSDSS